MKLVQLGSINLEVFRAQYIKYTRLNDNFGENLDYQERLLEIYEYTNIYKFINIFMHGEICKVRQKLHSSRVFSLFPDLLNHAYLHVSEIQSHVA